MHIDKFDYNLPKELIAQHPAEKREQSRLMVIHRDSGKIEHRHFYDIVSYLKPGDCLVLNDSKVIAARLFGFKANATAESGGKAAGCENKANAKIRGARVEFLLIRRIEGDIWQVMVRPGKKLKIGDEVVFTSQANCMESTAYDAESTTDGAEIPLRAVIRDYGEDGTRLAEFFYKGNFFDIIDRIGSMPLPPYIEQGDESEARDRYQTVYCREEGSVAAPTAGLHFTGELLDKAREKGVKIAFVTLHVGIGTFRPVKCDMIEDHKMHFEMYSIDEQNAEIINKVRMNGGRVICVGTTSARTVESAAGYGESAARGFQAVYESGDAVHGGFSVKPGHGDTDIFIYPGYSFKMVDALITNFHLPKSTLLMLISALYDREKILAAYDEAIREKYRFFSYGDAMFIV